MRGIKIPPQDFPLKTQGGLMRKGGAYLRDTTVTGFRNVPARLGGIDRAEDVGTVQVDRMMRVARQWKERGR